MNARGKSGGSIVPMSPANNGDAESSTEPAEGRVPARRNTKQSNLDRTPKPAHRRSRGLYGVREPAQKRRKLKFTNLLHHISVELLTSSFYQLKKKAAVGIDRVSWHEYEQDHEDRIVDLHGRIHRGAFRATPSKRVYIEKADGRKRPLGIPSLEDKIVQQAVRTVLQCIDEEDFVGFSYGFRPHRSQHQALDALYVAITEKRVNWILDADIEGFFDNIDRDWLVRFIEHRVGDKRLVRLILKWLKAGIVEGTDWSDNGKGTPQGAVVSPLLANVFLHYVFDLWIDPWRKQHAKGDCIAVRYADDFVIGFEHDAVGQTGRWLTSVVRGWQQYYSVPDNYDRLEQFDKAITKLWRRQLQRRSQRGKSRWSWKRMNRLVQKYLPRPRIIQPRPSIRHHARLRAGAV